MPEPTDVAPGPTLAQADLLVAEGRPLDALDLLVAGNREWPRAALQERLVDLRHEAFDAVPRIPAEQLPPPVRAEAAPATLVEITPEELDLDALRRGLAQQGCVLVRGLLSRDRALALAAGIDEALAAFDRGPSQEGAGDGWYRQFVPRPGAYRVGGRRQWVRASGAVWTADSPRMLQQLIDVVDETGIGALVTQYLGERPVLSANKSTLRRVPLTAKAGWHQDGAFLGEAVRTLNLWLALGACGTDAPGLDLVPRRLEHVVPTGTEGAIFDWSVSPDEVARAAGDVGVVRPEFEPGDALLFDHLLLHSTAVTEAMTRERHAIETWFFSPSAYPEGQIPLVY